MTDDSKTAGGPSRRKVKPFAPDPRSGTVKFPDRVPILERLELWLMEGKPMRQFCREPGNPSRALVHLWLQESQEWSERVARAKDIGFAQIAEECLEIADTPVVGVTETEEDDDDGDVKRKLVREDMLGHRKLRVETRLKLLACWDPKRYGQKAQIEHQGGLQIVVETGVPIPAPEGKAALGGC